MTLDGNRNRPPRTRFAFHRAVTYGGCSSATSSGRSTSIAWESIRSSGAILDAFAYTGRLPISNGSIDLTHQDDIMALVLEMMVRQTKTGMSSTVRDRNGAFRTASAG